MSQTLIHYYLAELDRLKRASGSTRESVVREAFKDLLKGSGRQHDLVFVPEYELETNTRERRYVDGALLHELRLPFGYWEAKDEGDKLDDEIALKFKRGYPQDNIIFEDSTQAVLIQQRQEVMRCDVTDVAQLEKLLKLFFGHERPEISGFRKAVEQFKTDLPAVLGALRDMIERQQAENPGFKRAAAEFLKHAQEAINPGLNAADVREMLIQHVLTEEIFAKVFDDSDFHRKNNVARELYRLEETFFTGGVKRDTLKGLEPYYAAIRAAAAQIGSHHEKQTFLKVIYENFYKVYNAKAADRLGVVYTPNEIVRFMIEGADWLTEKHFGRNLIDKDVEILDPATGTGTFICELLEHFRGQPAKLKYKYSEELHANEVAILPYYVANLNIEATYAAITGRYEEFANLCFVDTLDNVGLHTLAHGSTADLFGSVSDENVARIKRQNARRISVVIGNPPYNANQANENDNNKNRAYPAIDARIKQTYIAESTAQKTKLYDMYARFWRWAGWGQALMDLHIGYEQASPWALKRTDTPDTRARTAGVPPKCSLKADPATGRITIDSETVLDGVPPAAWAYKLGNRSAIDWVLDQHKERKPKDPTIRERFDTYRFADHKDRVIALLARVVTVSVETVRLVEAIKAAPR